MVPLNIVSNLEGARVPIFVYFPRPVAGVRFTFFTLGKPLWKELRERKPLLPPGSGIIIFIRTEEFLLCLANTSILASHPLSVVRGRWSTSAAGMPPRRGLPRLCLQPCVRGALRPWAWPVSGRGPCAELCRPPPRHPPPRSALSPL